VGVMTLGPLLAKEGVGIVLTMILSTVVPMLVFAFGLELWLRRRAGGEGGHAP